MEIRTKTTDYEMPLETERYLQDRLQSLEKLLGTHAQTARCEVELGRAIGHSLQGNVWKAEFVMVLGGERLRAEAVAETVNAAIDAAKDEMQQQLRKTKGKSATLTRRTGAKIKEWLRFGSKT